MNNIIRKPLTTKEIIDQADDDNFITGIVPVDFGYIIDNNLECFLDELSELLTGTCCLMQISYKCVGVEDDGQTLLIEVSGDVNDILDDAEDEED